MTLAIDRPDPRVLLSRALQTGGETDAFDFKETLDFRNNPEHKIKLLKAIGSFGNTDNGGHIIIGVTDDRHVVGITPELAKTYDQTPVQRLAGEYFAPPPVIQVRPSPPPIELPLRQWEGAPDLDERADVWTLGVTLCELATGHVPFEGTSLQQVYFAMTAGQPLRLRERFPQLSARLEAVIIKCLERDRAKRYRNVAEVALALVSPQSKPLVDRICSMPKRES